MVHVFVLGITATEFVVHRSVAEGHGLRHLVFVENDDIVFVANNWSVGSADTGNLGGCVVRILIDALVAEAVDATHSTIELYTREVGAVVAVKLVVEACQTRFIHSGDLVLVIGESEVDVEAELLVADDAVTVDVELPTDVLHVADVLIGEGGITRRGRNASAGHKQVGGVLPIQFNITRDALVEETEVGTEVVGFLLFPLEVAQLNVLRVDTTFAEVAATIAVLAEEESLGTRLPTTDTPTRTDGEHRDEGQCLLEPRLSADVPTN